MSEVRQGGMPINRTQYGRREPCRRAPHQRAGREVCGDGGRVIGRMGAHRKELPQDEYP